MQIKNTMSITQGRKEIYAIAKELQEKEEYFTLTERGKPAVVLLAAEKFESMLKKIGQAKKMQTNFLASHGVGFVCDGMGKEIYRTRTARKVSERKANDFELRILERGQKILFVCDNDQVVYSSERAIDRINSRQNLVVAQLYVELIEKYDYPIDSIKIGAYVKIGEKNSKRFIEADILVYGRNFQSNLLFAVSEFENFEKNEKLKVGELFDLAHELKKTSQKISHLIYFSRKYSKGSLKQKIKVINGKKFGNLKAWQKAGCPFEKTIPSY